MSTRRERRAANRSQSQRAAGTKAPVSGRQTPSRVVRSTSSDRSRLYRNTLVVGGALAGLLIIGFLFLQPPGPIYRCTSELPAPAVQEDAQGLGFATPDMGNTHVPFGSSITYAACPPTSGDHYFPDQRVPIPARVYPANEERAPGGWVHNLEHGWVALLYRCPSGAVGTADCLTTEEQATVQQWFDAQPNVATCGKQALAARFDSISTRFALVAWDRALLVDDLDLDQALTFAEQWTDNPALPEAPVC